MAISFCQAKKICRTASGRSAVSAAAYRAGEKLHDEESGKDWSYKKDEVTYSKITLPDNAPPGFADRATLWNSVQKAETQANAMLSRELVIALPNELDQKQAEKLIDNFSKYLAKKGMCVDAAIHWKDGNHHAHLMLTTRKIDKNGKWAKWKERKEYARDENGNKIPDLDENGKQKLRVRKGKGAEKLWKRVTVQENEWSKKKSLNEWKSELAQMMNRELEKSGVNAKIDYRSYKEQGSELIPQIHEGYAARAIEKRGGKSWKCEKNREIRATNKAFIEKTSKLKAELKELKNELKDTVTFCDYMGLEPNQRKSIVKVAKPMLLSLEKDYIKKFPVLKGKIDFQGNFFQNAVFAKSKKGFVLVGMNKESAIKNGLLENAGQAKTFTMKQVKGIAQGVKTVAKDVTSLLDDKVSSEQHMSKAKDNVMGVLKTPFKALGEIIKNPATGILKLPLNIFKMISDAASAGINMVGAVGKGGTMLGEEKKKGPERSL